MKFLLDENFPVTAAAFIESCGHQAIPFLSAYKSGDDDEAVFAAAQRQKAVILTSIETSIIPFPCFIRCIRA